MPLVKLTPKKYFGFFTPSKVLTCQFLFFEIFLKTRRLSRVSSVCVKCSTIISKNESQPTADGRVCQMCRNSITHLRCSAVKCRTPLFKQNEVGVSSSPKCCAAGYLRLQRLTRSAEYSNLQSLNVSHPVGLPPMAYKEASERTRHTIKQKIKTWAKQRIGEMKAEIENMGASYKEICLEIL